MFLIAVDYPPGAPLVKLPELAKLLGKTAYELRSRVSIPVGGPAVLETCAEREQALVVEAGIRGLGFQTLLLGAEEAAPGATQFVVRRFGLEESSLWVESRQGERIQVGVGGAAVLLRGISFSTETNTETTTKKKFNLGRAVASGGLIRNKKVKTTRETTTKDGQGMLLLYTNAAAPALVFLENNLLFDSLGDAMLPSRSANFLFLVGALRKIFPTATFDDRFLRRAGQKQLLGALLEPESHLHIATALLGRSLLASRDS